MSTGRILALLFGIVMVLVGIAGYVPQLIKQGNLLFGYFAVNPMHNNIHILTGVIAMLASMRGDLARYFFQIFGLVYAVVALIGFTYGHLFGMPLNMADNWLHVGIAALSLLLGFFYRRF